MERMLGKGTQSEGDLVFVDTFREMHSDSSTPLRAGRSIITPDFATRDRA